MKKSNKFNCLAVIPARPGSTRVKNKNFIKFFGKKMFEHTLDFAKKSNLFKDIVVSTNKESLKKYKIIQEYARPISLCKNNTDLVNVVAHALNFYEKKNKIKYDFICILWATSPLRTQTDIINSFKKLKDNNVNGVVGVSEYYYYPGCATIIDKNGFLKPLTSKLFWLSSQERPKILVDCGSFAWVRKDIFLKEKSWFPKKSLPYTLPYYKGIDLDEPKHLELLNFYYKKYKT